MVSRIDDFDIVLCDTNLEALILECNLIKLHKPQYNILLKDDKHYPYLRIDVTQDYPRVELVRRGTADLPNVQVCPSGPYMISAMTFPTYFLKETEDPSAIQSALDITIFGRCIAPALGITRRFAGTEPLDAVTRVYNETMARLLPGFGVEFREMERVSAGEAPISASRVRRLLGEKGGVTEEVRALVPETTAEYLLDRFGEGRA